MGCGAAGGYPSADLPDYYRLLQVDPDAPRELIAEAYWHLASRLQESRGERPSLRAQLDGLNEAYATLISPEKRKAYDATLPRVTTLRQERARAIQTANQRSWLSLLNRKRPSRVLPQCSDYYSALHVDPSAEPGIVDKAYLVLHRLHSNGVVLSDAELEEAHAVLADPARRAAYDASCAAPAEADASQTAVCPPPTGLTGLPSPAAEPAASAPEASAPALETVTPAPDGALSSGEAALSVPLEPAGKTPAAQKEQRDSAGQRWGLAEAALRKRLSEVVFRASAAAGALFASAVKTSSQQSPEVLDELLATRLRRGIPPVPTGDAAREAGKEPAPLARLVLADSSGHEQILQLGLEPITLGANSTCDVLLEDERGTVAAEHARIWYGGGRFILHSVAERYPTIAGGKPVVWAALEHGDEIQIGSWRIRFEMLQPQSDIPEHLKSDQPDSQPHPIIDRTAGER